ncbi:inositol phospholipid biosynthesis protein [Grosmannia clavigera kw1407]|uniref:Inositol phospholipid biosynthesis protein n=1 Tax=Grosmannia clavigera (strain kw1407 / UAMH 11150) TaxID=655863 RepID=F0XPI2_GROCL|nr:inositol phospholipid biosynthesis protein [Grosmannia clavigera kw1407]EFX00703.1 inositol phospholipid biosynthesis protein [Grosmannia clavigera kw1407]
MSELAQNDRSSSTRPPAAFSPPSAKVTAKSTAGNRPYLPTYREAVLLAAFPVVLLFGMLFSLLSPSGRTGVTDVASVVSSAPSYFARKDNVLNVFFVKRGWFWISLAFAQFVLRHPSFTVSDSERSVSGTSSSHTIFGSGAPQPSSDRSFRLTGGSCQADGGLGVAEATSAAATAAASLAAVAVASMCKRAGGRWSGGHDISGHVFLLVLGSTFLAQEVGWVLLRARGERGESQRGRDGRQPEDDRTIVMADGAIKTAEVEAEAVSAARLSLVGVQFVGTILVLSLWMLLMTAIYFHTGLEKLSGLLVALAGLYGVYVVPRFVPAVRRVVGLPGL